MARTVWLGLFGRLAPRVAEPESDPYQLFVGRSVAMGWLTDAMGRGTAGKWGINDAGFGEPPLVAWFQVELTETTGLALQPLLACASAVVARFGELDLDAVQLLIPPPALPAPLGELAQAAVWFNGPPSADQTSVMLTVDGGQDPTIVEVTADVVSGIAKLHQNVFTCTGHTATVDETSSPVQPLIPDSMWAGSPRHALELAGTLAKWGPDVVAWAAELVARSCHDAGVTAPFLLTVRRSAS